MSTFHIGDRVQKSFFHSGCSMEGTVVAVNGRWVTVKHDFGDQYGGAVGRVPPRFDYMSEELQHLNPLLRLADEL